MKHIIKKISIIFFIILLLLTFFSKTLLNYSLPCVSIQSITPGEIVSKIRGNGIIESNNNYEVKYGCQREIAGVEIRVGQHVDEGDILCSLKEVENKLLDEKAKELASAKKQYEKLNQELFIKKISKEAYDDFSNQEEISRNVKSIKNNIIKLEADIINYQEIINQFDDYKKEVNKQIDLEPEKDDFIWDEYQRYINIKNEYRDKCIDYAIEQNNYNVAEYTLQFDDESDEQETRTKEALKKKEQALIEKDRAEYKLLLEEKKIDDAKRVLKDLLKSIQTEMDKTSDLMENTLDELKKNQEELTKIIDKLNNTYDIYQCQAEIEMAKQEVEEKQEEYEELLQLLEQDTIVSPIAGTVVEIYVKKNQIISKNGIVVSIHPDDADYSCCIVANKAQSKLISIGDEATFLYDNNSTGATAVVSKILPNDTDKNKVDIIFDVTGEDIYLGQSIRLMVGKKGEHYDFTVPNIAIREDVNGTFIYILDTINTPLGIKHYARRVDVDILATNENSSAILGDLVGDEYIITSTNRLIGENDQVRILP